MECRLKPDPLPIPQHSEDKEDIKIKNIMHSVGFPFCSWNYNHLTQKKINETLRGRLSLNHKIKVVRSRRPYVSTTTTIAIVTFVLITSLSFVIGRSEKGRQTTNNNGIFIQLPYSSPPTVRPPPYAESEEICPAMNLHENWIDTVCGDLNKGYIPSNPLGHKFADDTSYPFEIIKNKTLVFFRHALPILKNDKSLPKVARFNPYDDHQIPTPTFPTNQYFRRRNNRAKRSDSLTSMIAPLPWEHLNNSSELIVEGRSNQMSRIRFCDNLGGLSYFNRLCKMYNTMWGKAPHNIYHNYNQNQQLPQPQNHQRYDTSNENSNGNKRHYPQGNYMYQPQPQPQQLQYEALHQAEPSNTQSAETNMPPTPCPSSAEYLTPVFARNHEGAWRYVVQIPREGYFTQTVEVTKCTEINCYYMDGTCRTSPRWQSLLVAELYYPDKRFPLATPPVPEVEKAVEFHKHQRYIQKRKARTGRAETEDTSENRNGNDLNYDQIPKECDGLDEIGCFQVRLFYDWFLIPGSCKCWARQFDFTRVHQQKHNQ